MMAQNADKNRSQVHFFCMDDIVPKDHLLRLIDRAMNWSFIYELVRKSILQIMATQVLILLFS